ncbi:PilZ domain-containing protein [Tsuneonella sp. HG222]
MVTSHIPFTTIGQRRAEARSATVLRPVLVQVGSFSGFCLVRNLSPNGMMGDIYANFRVGLTMRVQFAASNVCGTIVWCRDGRAGVRFIEPIDLETTLKALGLRTVAGRPGRAPRLKIRCAAEINNGKSLLSVSVRDISQRGLNVDGASVKNGEEVLVRLPGLQVRKAIVRWAISGSMGLNFLRPISIEELATWTVQQQMNDGNLEPFAASIAHGLPA